MPNWQTNEFTLRPITAPWKDLVLASDDRPASTQIMARRGNRGVYSIFSGPKIVGGRLKISENQIFRLVAFFDLPATAQRKRQCLQIYEGGWGAILEEDHLIQVVRVE